MCLNKFSVIDMIVGKRRQESLTPPSRFLSIPSISSFHIFISSHRSKMDATVHRMSTPLMSVNVANAGLAQLQGSTPMRSSNRGATVPPRIASSVVNTTATETVSEDIRDDPGVKYTRTNDATARMDAINNPT